MGPKGTTTTPVSDLRCLWEKGTPRSLISFSLLPSSRGLRIESPPVWSFKIDPPRARSAANRSAPYNFSSGHPRPMTMFIRYSPSFQSQEKKGRRYEKIGDPEIRARIGNSWGDISALLVGIWSRVDWSSSRVSGEIDAKILRALPADWCTRGPAIAVDPPVESAVSLSRCRGSVCTINSPNSDTAATFETFIFAARTCLR